LSPFFASNISRIQQIVDIAEKRDSKVIFNGRSIEASVRIAKQLGYLRIPEDMEIDIGQVGDFPNDRLMFITTGSQGEPMSVLARMASGIHKQVKIQDGDTVILSSKFIPGNEKAIARSSTIFIAGARTSFMKRYQIFMCQVMRFRKS